MAEKYGEVPKRFTKAWWSYYWMYYKWQTIGAAFIVVAVAGTAVQCATREKYDLNVDYCGSAYYTEETLSALETELEKYASDADGNGEVNVFVQQLNFSNNGSSAEVDSALQIKHDMELSTDYSYLFIYDKTEAEMIIPRDSSSSVYMNVGDYLPEDMQDRGVMMGSDGVPCAVSLEGSAMLESLGIDPSGLYAAIRQDYSGEEYNIAAQNSAKEIVKAMLAQ